jgi:hypothetical protein
VPPLAAAAALPSPLDEGAEAAPAEGASVQQIFRSGHGGSRSEGQRLARPRPWRPFNSTHSWSHRQYRTR